MKITHKWTKLRSGDWELSLRFFNPWAYAGYSVWYYVARSKADCVNLHRHKNEMQHRKTNGEYSHQYRQIKAYLEAL